MKVAIDRLTLGQKGRGRVRVIAITFDPSPYSYLGLEPVSARLGDPDRRCSLEKEQK
jgi:hypothetical protein